VESALLSHFCSPKDVVLEQNVYAHLLCRPTGTIMQRSGIIVEGGSHWVNAFGRGACPLAP